MKKYILLYAIMYAPLLYSSAITWQPNGGRFGDNLLSYSKAKWLSSMYDIPLLYLPFTYSDQLMMHEYEQLYTPDIDQQFETIIHLPASTDYALSPDSNTLYISHWQTPVIIDWFNMNFIEELRKTIAPRNNIEKIMIPTNVVSIAAHVRNGGGYDSQQEKERCPLRFAPEEFFIAQIERIAMMFPQNTLYVHIFTDHPEPTTLVKKFNNALHNPRIGFGCRTEHNTHSSNVLEDFFSMMDFDCLIRPGSHFSRFVERLGNNKVVIYPDSVQKNPDGSSTIDVITIKTRPDIHTRWKTEKIRIIKRRMTTMRALQIMHYQKKMLAYLENRAQHNQNHAHSST
jgi:hypothetical protein